MRWLLDTNVCIDVLRGRSDVISRFRDCAPEDVGISVVTAFELVQGAGRAPEKFRKKESRKVAVFLAMLRQVDFDGNCARLAGEINASLMNRGTPVSVTDVFIAATAMNAGLPVVTSNVRDFEKIEGLAFVDWRE